jgi:hypothetical protein
MRLVVVSDTHRKHGELGTLKGNVLIHCGDFCNGLRSELRDLQSIDAWFAEQQFELVLCVGGNHDFPAEERSSRGDQVFRNAVWLQDAGWVHRGVNFYGAPREGTAPFFAARGPLPAAALAAPRKMRQSPVTLGGGEDARAAGRK